MQKYFIDVIVNHYFDFRGKATRTQYWMFVLWGCLFALVLFVVALILGIFSPKLAMITTIVKWCVLFIPSTAIMVRRLRDGGFSPWLVLLILPTYMYIGFSYLITSASSQTASPILLIMLLGISLLALVSSIILLVLLCLPSKDAD